MTLLVLASAAALGRRAACTAWPNRRKPEAATPGDRPAPTVGLGSRRAARAENRNAPVGDRGVCRAAWDGATRPSWPSSSWRAFGAAFVVVLAAVAFGAAAFAVVALAAVVCRLRGRRLGRGLRGAALAAALAGAFAGPWSCAGRRRPRWSRRRARCRRGSSCDSAARALPAAVWAPLALTALPAAMRALAAFAAAALPVDLATWPPSRPAPADGRVDLAREARLASGGGVRVDRAGLGRAVERGDRVAEDGSRCRRSWDPRSRSSGTWRRASSRSTAGAGGSLAGARPGGRASARTGCELPAISGAFWPRWLISVSCVRSWVFSRAGVGCPRRDGEW